MDLQVDLDRKGDIRIREVLDSKDREVLVVGSKGRVEGSQAKVDIKIKVVLEAEASDSTVPSQAIVPVLSFIIPAKLVLQLEVLASSQTNQRLVGIIVKTKKVVATVAKMYGNQRILTRD